MVITEAWDWGNEELLFDGCKVSVLQKKNISGDLLPNSVDVLDSIELYI